MKSVLIVSCLFLMCQCGTEEDFKLIDSLHPEDPCSRSGGMCTIAADCPKGMLAGEGLCPHQRSKGVECCYGFSVKETRCGKHGGSCVSQHLLCNQRSIYPNATDCPPGTKCRINL